MKKVKFSGLLILLNVFCAFFLNPPSWILFFTMVLPIAITLIISAQKFSSNYEKQQQNDFQRDSIYLKGLDLYYLNFINLLGDMKHINDGLKRELKIVKQLAFLLVISILVLLTFLIIEIII
jgi:hypothetical protein